MAGLFSNLQDDLLQLYGPNGIEWLNRLFGGGGASAGAGGGGTGGGGTGGGSTPPPGTPTPPEVMPPQALPWGLAPDAIRQMIQDQAQYAMAMTPHPSLPEEGKNRLATRNNATGTPYFNWSGPWSPYFKG